MKVQEKAKLYRDSKGLWRTKTLNAKRNDKGMAVPPSLRNTLTDAHDGALVKVVKVNGQIERLLFEDSDAHDGVKQGSHQVQESKKTPQPTTQEDLVSPAANDNCLPSIAVFAYDCAKDALRLGAGYKEYKNHAKSLTMMIRTNGFGATMAFLESKKERHFVRLRDDIAKFLSQHNQALSVGEFHSMAITKLDSHTVKELTKAVLLFVGWLRHFSSGLIQR